MNHDFIDDLLQPLNRVLVPDRLLLREVLICSGMPRPTQNLQYVGYNRQFLGNPDDSIEYSAVAVVNNRRSALWRLEGYRRTISRLVFHPWWTFNPLDLFLCNLRCHPGMMDMIGAAAGRYTLLGILETKKRYGTGAFSHVLHKIRPLVAIPGLGDSQLEAVATFEAESEIRKMTLHGVTVYRRFGR